MHIDGKCHCGFISYEAEVDPEEVCVCHCTDCQSFSGSAFRWAVPVPEKDFKLLSGEPKVYVKQAESGTLSRQLFCPECASPIYGTSLGAEPKVFYLRLGTARQRAQLRPKTQYWYRSAQNWTTVHQPCRRFETE